MLAALLVPSTDLKDTEALAGRRLSRSWLADMDGVLYAPSSAIAFLDGLRPFCPRKFTRRAA